MQSDGLLCVNNVTKACDPEQLSAQLAPMGARKWLQDSWQEGLRKKRERERLLLMWFQQQKSNRRRGGESEALLSQLSPDTGGGGEGFRD